MKVTQELTGKFIHHPTFLGLVLCVEEIETHHLNADVDAPSDIKLETKRWRKATIFDLAYLKIQGYLD